MNIEREYDMCIYVLIKKILKYIRAFFLRKYYKPFIEKIPSSYIICECSVSMNKGILTPQNWGDDLNCYFFEKISGKKVINIPFTKMYCKDIKNVYCLIGSILAFFNLDGKIVYGSGIMDPKVKLQGKPQKIISVRGPRTREALMQQGIGCPENYGDPALLLPCVYKYDGLKHNRPVLIPNMGTFNNDISLIKNIAQKLNAIVLDLRNYDKWTDPIDTIVGASYVISESLHGLIVAETYGIPNVWVEFIQHPDYWDFKFDDFYGSIGKDERIIKIKRVDDVEKACKKIETWKRGNIDYEKLKSLFPFQAHWLDN